MPTLDDEELQKFLHPLILKAKDTGNWEKVMQTLRKNQSYTKLGEVLLHAVHANKKEIVTALIAMGAKSGDWHLDNDQTKNVLYFAIMNDDPDMFIKLLETKPYIFTHFVKMLLQKMLKEKPAVVAQINAMLIANRIKKLEQYSSSLIDLILETIPEEAALLEDTNKGLYEAAFIKTILDLLKQEQIDMVFTTYTFGYRYHVYVTDLLMKAGVSTSTILKLLIKEAYIPDRYLLQILSPKTQEEEGSIVAAIKNTPYLQKRLDNILGNRDQIDTFIKNIQDKERIPNFLMQVAIASNNWLLIESLALQFPGKIFLDNALEHAMKNQKWHLIDILLNAGANPQKAEEILSKISEKSPYMEAFIKSAPEQRKKMLAQGAEYSNEFLDALYRFKDRDQAASEAHSVPSLEEKDADTIEKDYQSALCNAARANNTAAVECLLKERRSFNTNYKDEKGNTALHWAVHHNNFEMVHQLLKAGADPNIINKKGNTAIRLAANMNHLFIMEFCRGSKQQRDKLLTDFKAHKYNIKTLDTMLLNEEKSKKKKYLARLALAGNPAAIINLAKRYKDKDKPHKAMLFFCLASAYSPENKKHFEEEIKKLKIPDNAFKDFILECLKNDDFGKNIFDKLREEYESLGPIPLMLLVMEAMKAKCSAKVNLKLEESILSAMQDAQGISKTRVKVSAKLRMPPKDEELIKQNKEEIDNIKKLVQKLVPQFEAIHNAPTDLVAIPSAPTDLAVATPSAPTALEVFKHAVEKKLSEILNWSPSYATVLEADQALKLACDLILQDVQKFMELEKGEKLSPTLRFKKTSTDKDFPRQIYSALHAEIRSWLLAFSKRSEEEIDQAMLVIMEDVQVSLSKGEIIRPGFFEKRTGAAVGTPSTAPATNPEESTEEHKKGPASTDFT